MIIRLVKMTFHEQYSSDFEKLFESVRDRIAECKGCQHVELLRDTSDGEHCIYFTRSIWDREEDLQSYRSSELFASTWKSTKALFAKKAEAWSTNLISVSNSDRKLRSEEL